MDPWKGKWLSNVGRATMLKSVLSAIPTYQMSCVPLSQGVKKMEKKLRMFYWQGSSKDRKLTLIRWEKICRPLEVGDICLKNMSW